MAKSSSELWGSDYVGASLEDICMHLEGYRESTSKLIKNLKKYKSAIKSKTNKLANKLKKYKSGTIKKSKSRLKNYGNVIRFVDFSIETHNAYLCEFDRLLSEIQEGLTETHIEMLEALIESNKRYKDLCVQFKSDHISRKLSDESMRPLFDNIYEDTRSETINYYDLSNVRTRLKTFIKAPLKKNGLKSSNKKESIKKRKRGRQQFTFKSKVMKTAKKLRSKNSNMSITDMIYRNEIISAINPDQKAFKKDNRPSNSEYKRILRLSPRTVFQYISEALKNN